MFKNVHTILKTSVQRKYFFNKIFIGTRKIVSKVLKKLKLFCYFFKYTFGIFIIFNIVITRKKQKEV